MPTALLACNLLELISTLKNMFCEMLSVNSFLKGMYSPDDFSGLDWHWNLQGTVFSL